MEGFVNNSFSSFDNGLRHSKVYANYGVDKIDSSKETKERNSDKTTYNQLCSNNLAGKNNYINTDILDDITENIDKTVTETVDTITTPNQKGHQRLKTAGIIGTSAIITGGIVLGLTRGNLSKKMVGRLSELLEQGNLKIKELQQKSSNSKIDEYYLRFLQMTNKGVSKIRGAFFNITPLKDVMFKRIFQQKLGLDKPCNAITNFFRKLSFRTVKSAYRHAGNNLEEFADLLTGTNKKIKSGEIKTTKPILNNTLETIEKSINSLKLRYKFFFGEKALNTRNNEVIEKFDGLSDRVYDSVYGKIKDFVVDVDEWTTFVPEKLIAKDKAKIIAEVTRKKNKISNNPQDTCNCISDYLSALVQKINPKDTASINNIKTINSLVGKYRTVAGIDETAGRKEITELISGVLDELGSVTPIYNGERLYTKIQCKQINEIVNEIRKVLTNDKKGEVEELLSFYKSVLPEYEYVKIEKSALKLSKSLNRAVHKEGSEYVDKARDLAVGSALTDVAIGMGVPLATTSIAMSAADTKQKKRSVVLKYGIPLLMGVATSTLCTIALISGGYALMLGGTVSLIGNEILEKLDNYLIKRDKEKEG